MSVWRPIKKHLQIADGIVQDVAPYAWMGLGIIGALYLMGVLS
jgi:hypothetical protein